LLLAVLLLAGCATAPVVHEAAFDWRAHGILFKVDPIPEAGAEVRANAAVPAASYILGTYHSGDFEALRLDRGLLQSRVSSSQRLIIESPTGQLWNPANDGHRELGNGNSLDALIGAEAYARLSSLLPGIDPAQLRRSKPWLALTMLEIAGEDPTQSSMDANIEEWAAKAGLPVTSLETIEVQLAALDCVPAQEHAAVLRARLDSGWSFPDESSRALAYYRAGDLAGWLSELRRMDGLDDHGQSAELRAQRCLIEDRNQRWIGLLTPYLHNGGAFVAVGALHLTGDSGLLAQLAKQGFRVTVEPR